jgi:hypothetical protein
LRKTRQFDAVLSAQASGAAAGTEIDSQYA